MTIKARFNPDKVRTKISDSIGRMADGIVELFPQFFV
jgi:hypothetical protein